MAPERMPIEPIAFPTPAGTVVRGQRWGESPNWVVLVHDLGEDLDAWGDLPPSLAAQGYTALVIDLPGYGLSDDPADAASDAHGEAIAAALATAATQGARRRFLAVAGASTEAALAAAQAEPLDALIVLSPPAATAGDDRLRELTAPKLVAVGAAEPAALAAAQAFFQRGVGWAVLSTVGVPEQGTGLLRSAWGDQVGEQMLLFLRNYRV